MVSCGKLVEELYSAIEREYAIGKYNLGWRLLTCPVANIQSSEICFIGLNPAGKSPDKKNDGFSSERGSSYKIEEWGIYPPGEAPLQRQVCALFEFIEVPPNQILSGNLIPFRSPRIFDLPNKARAINFSENIWRKMLKTSNVKLVITMGNDVTRSLSKILKIPHLEKFPSGWGNVSLYAGKHDNITLVGLPHLSTFKLLSRSVCSECLRAVFKSNWS